MCYINRKSKKNVNKQFHLLLIGGKYSIILSKDLQNGGVRYEQNCSGNYGNDP